MEDIIFEALKVQIGIVQVEASNTLSSLQQKGDDLQHHLALLQTQYDACGREKLAQYKAYREGKITDEMFLHSRDQLTAQQNELKEQIAECEKQYEASQQEMETSGEKQEAVGHFVGLTEKQLRDHLYDAIERVLVYGPDSVEIVWKFQDSTMIAS